MIIGLSITDGLITARQLDPITGEVCPRVHCHRGRRPFNYD